MNPIDYLKLRTEELSENKIFIGMVMIIVNIGARYIIEELSDEHRNIIKSPYVRKIIIFCSVFMATRDIIISLIVTIIFTILINEILNDDKPVEDKKENNDKSSSFVKGELDKQIDQLKLIKDSL